MTFRLIRASGFFTIKKIALKIAEFSIFMTKDCWGNAENHFASKLLADAILKGFKTGAVTKQTFHFGIDQDVWEQLEASDDDYIKEKMARLKNHNFDFKQVDTSQATSFLKFKFRGIDPWISHKGKKNRLSFIDHDYRESFNELSQLSKKGWPVKEN